MDQVHRRRISALRLVDLSIRKQFLKDNCNYSLKFLSATQIENFEHGKDLIALFAFQPLKQIKAVK